MKWDDAIQEIKRRTDMVQVVGQYVKLRRAGQNWIGLCPFHHEKSPSFSVNREHGFFKCFGCNESGDVYTFLEKQSGKLFADIVQELAQSLQISIEDGDAPWKNERVKKNKELRDVLQIALNYFQEQLAISKPSSQGPYAYLKQHRHLSDAMIADFQLGYGGEHTHTFMDFLKKHAVTVQSGLDAGILKKGASGIYAFFSGRIVVPIYDAKGNLCAFGGRIWLPEQHNRPKYVNSTASHLYDKTSTLFGLYKAIGLMKNERPVVIVEGYFDVMAVYAAGYAAVAPCGTSLTKEQVQLLGRYTNHVILCMDQDKAGEQATRRALLLLLSHGFEVRLVHLPTKDPDELFQQGKLEMLKGLLLKAPDALETLIMEITKQRLMGVTARVAALDTLMPFLAVLPRPIVRQQYVRLCAQAFGEDPAIIAQELARLSPQKIENALHPTPPAAPRPKGTYKPVKWTGRERLLARVMFFQPQLSLACSDALLKEQNPVLRAFVRQLQITTREHPHMDAMTMIRQTAIVPDPVLIEILREGMRQPGLMDEREGSNIVKSLHQEREVMAKKAEVAKGRLRFIELSQTGDEAAIRAFFTEQTQRVRDLAEASRALQAISQVPSEMPAKPVIVAPSSKAYQPPIKQEELEDDGWY